MSKHVSIALSADERQNLDNLIRKGDAPARVQTRARIPLLSDQSQGQHRTEQQIADALLCSPSTVGNVRPRFAKTGLQAAVYEKARPAQAPKITGDIEAQLTLLACSDAPPGKARWTVRLLADKLVEMGCPDTISHISHVAVQERLKKERKPWQVKRWCIGQPWAKYVAKMEDVLDVYARPYDPKRPQVCFDECSDLSSRWPDGAG